MASFRLDIHQGACKTKVASYTETLTLVIANGYCLPMMVSMVRKQVISHLLENILINENMKGRLREQILFYELWCRARCNALCEEDGTYNSVGLCLYCM